jgi:Trk K+ transport system NAD-binding subunit
MLKQYGAIVSAIDCEPTPDWELPDLPNLLDEFVIGDCRHPNVLIKVKIQQCRAILLVTSDERVNTEAAFAARLLNPQIRLIVRSEKHNLNQLLRQNLGNFIAYEPTQLAAAAFALTALGNETLGYFKLDDWRFQVVRKRIQASDRWCNRRYLWELNSSKRHILSHQPHLSPTVRFHQWQPETILREHDTLVYVEAVDTLSDRSPPAETAAKSSQWQQWRRGIFQDFSWQRIGQKILQLWQLGERYRAWRAIGVCSAIVLMLLCSATLVWRWQYPDLSWFDALNATIVLLLGGFDELFGELRLPFAIPPWLYLFSLSLTIAGTIFVGILYATLTEALLSSRFQLFARRLRVPQQNHVVLVGLDRLGQRVADLLQEFKQPLVGLDNTASVSSILPHVPILCGSIVDTLEQAHLSDAKSIIVATNDDMLNLEIGLMTRAASPHCGIVIRTYGRHFSDRVAQLFPYAQVLCVSALSAEVFAAAAFGESVIGLFHFQNQTILVTEYSIEAGDTLNELILAEVAYGYGVVPILYQRSGYHAPRIMPTDDTRLHVGDRLVVLATSHSLQRIERGELAPKHSQVKLERAITSDALFHGANEIALISGCDLQIARKVMQNLPAILPVKLYQHQAQRLVRELSRLRVIAHLLE